MKMQNYYFLRSLLWDEPLQWLCRTWKCSHMSNTLSSLVIFLITWARLDYITHIYHYRSKWLRAWWHQKRTDAICKTWNLKNAWKAIYLNHHNYLWVKIPELNRSKNWNPCFSSNLNATLVYKLVLEGPSDTWYWMIRFILFSRWVTPNGPSLWPLTIEEDNCSRKQLPHFLQSELPL